MNAIQQPIQGAATALTETSMIQVGNMHLDFTTQFDFTSRLEGAEQAAGTWRPLARDGFYPLGDLMVQSFDDPNGIRVAMLARDDLWGPKPALMPPTGFTYVWSRQIFMMNAPAGYVALGGIGCGGDTPDPDLYRCVRRDLVINALVGNQIYDDRGSGRRDELSTWAIAAPPAPEKHANIAPTTFFPCPFRHAPGADGFYAFQIGLDDIPPAEPPPPPVLTSRNPPPETGTSVQYAARLPWFAVKDPWMNAADQLVNSPVYTIIRTDHYKRSMFKNNITDRDQQMSHAIVVGISEEATLGFAETVGVELGMEWTIAKDVFSVSAKLSYSFTYTTTNSHGMHRAEEVTDNLTIAANTAAASYYLASAYDIYRQDGTRIQSVVPEYGVPSSTYSTQYPASAPRGTSKSRKPATADVAA